MTSCATSWQSVADYRELTGGVHQNHPESVGVSLWVPNWLSTAVTCGNRWTVAVGHDRRSWRYDCYI
jgi:hypothetical protein